MATATGLNGDVTFANGYTDKIDSWTMNYFATPQDDTSFQPVDDHQTLCGDVIQGAEGQYTAKLCVGGDADITGSDYEPYARMWALRAECNPVMETSFGDDWHSWAPGLINTQFRMVSWIDDTESLPIGGSGTANLIVNDNDPDPDDEYVVDYITTAANTSISVDGEERQAQIEGMATGKPTINGSLPYAGIDGSATFTADGSTSFGGDIIVTACEVRVDRPAQEGQVTIEFIVDGPLA